MEGGTLHPAKAVLVAVVAALALITSPTPAVASLSALEARCELRIARAAAKFVKAHLSLEAACRERRAAGETLVCPDATSEARLSRLSYSLVAQARDTCTSYCSSSTSVPCISDLQCPPSGGVGGESCSGGQSDGSFGAANLGYPGPFCEQTLGRELASGADIGSCAAGLIDDVASRLTDAIYGGPAGPPVLSSTGAECLSALSAGARSLTVVTLKTAFSCRRKVQAGKLLSNPARCVDDDEGSRLRVKRVADKLVAAAVVCTSESVAELPVCGGSQGLSTPAQSAACFVDLVKQAVDPDQVPAERTFAAPSLLEAVYPPYPVCGDGIVNQGRTALLPLGEECDGASDDCMPGQMPAAGGSFRMHVQRPAALAVVCRRLDFRDRQRMDRTRTRPARSGSLRFHQLARELRLHPHRQWRVRRRLEGFRL